MFHHYALSSYALAWALLMSVDCVLSFAPSTPTASLISPAVRREIVRHSSRGNQGMEVLSDSRFDCVLLTIIYMSEPSCRPIGT